MRWVGVPVAIANWGLLETVIVLFANAGSTV